MTRAPTADADHPHRWKIASVLAALLIALHLMPGDLLGFEIDSELFDLAHPIIFALVTFGVSRYLARHSVEFRGIRLPPLLSTALGVGAFALFSEASQVLSSRDASFDDLIRDGFGIVSGIAFAYGVQRHHWQRALLWTASMAVLVVASWGPGRVMAARAAAIIKFPILADFENPLQRTLHRRIRARISIVEAPSGWPGGGHVLRVEPLPWADVSGVAVRSVARDIRGYDALKLSVAIEDASSGHVLVRIDTYGSESRGTRYQVRHDVAGEPTTLTIPLAEIAADVPDFMDEARYIRNVIVLAGSGMKSALLLDDVRLE